MKQGELVNEVSPVYFLDTPTLHSTALVAIGTAETIATFGLQVLWFIHEDGECYKF